jgi:uncharacterized membrane protein YtjA (UPF0391 family)
MTVTHCFAVINSTFKAVDRKTACDKVTADGLSVPSHLEGGEGMNTALSWALGFFVVAIIAAIFGFGGIAAGAADIAQFLFWLFVILFVVSLVMGLVRRPRV